MNSRYLFRKNLLRRGSRESNQNKHPLRSRFVVVIGGADFSGKDESRFTIVVLIVKAGTLNIKQPEGPIYDWGG